MPKLEHNSDLKYLYQAFLCLKTEEECRAFLADLCTEQELHSFAQRLEVAHLLEEKKVYSDIVRETGASTAIVSRVKRSISYGGEGYRVVFGRIGAK